jgi:putative ABC transport system permease protein
MPTTQWLNGGYTYIVRGNVPVTTLVPQLRRAVSSVDPLVPLVRVSTFDEALSGRLAMPRFTMLLLVMLGGTGLVLAIVGVYGVVSYFVTQRTHELGVRVALGASSGSLQWLVVRQGVTFAIVGVAIGGALGLAASRLLRSMIFGITPHDPITFAIVGLTLALVAVVASYIPARRATRIDPLEALRSS